jgi:asparagine synthase (glutamine-hydrolysing)
MADGRPCLIAFSGGRDSSILLAVATRLAREEGFDPPVPVTRRYPGIPEADETELQELVVRHLGLADWVRVDAAAELDLLSPQACESLLRRGVVWPPTVHREPSLYRLASGGHLLTGEGGDNVFDSRRITPVRHLFFERRRPTRGMLADAAWALVPAAATSRFERRDAVTFSWLRPAARREVRRLAAAAQAEPLRWDRAMLRDIRSRGFATGLRNLSIVAGDEGCDLHHPMLDRDFVAAVASVGGGWGLRSRNELMRLVFGPLLPDAIMRRTTKATFNEANFREHSRDFVERWEGGGLNDDLVDTAELARLWREPRVNGATFGLLQAAWLATEGASRAGMG